MPLMIEVANAQQRKRIEHRAGPLEMGRGPEQKWTRVIIFAISTVYLIRAAWLFWHA